MFGRFYHKCSTKPFSDPMLNLILNIFALKNRLCELGKLVPTQRRISDEM
jgi:hypothetical protein